MQTPEQPTPDSGSERLRYLKDLGRIGIFYFTGLSIFFITAFVIITLRVSVKDKAEVPVLAGKMYLDEHNGLIDRGFKVEIERTFASEYPYGLILSQSISPGRIVKDGTKIVLLVNQSENIVTTPKLTGISETLVPGVLSAIPIGSRIYKLVPGIITRISSDRPAGEVLAQFPAAGTPVVPLTPVDIIVSSGSDVPKSQAGIEGMPAGLVTQYAHISGRPVTIATENTDDYLKNNKVLRAEISGEGLRVVIARFPQSEGEKKREYMPFRERWIPASDLGLDGETVTLMKPLQGDLEGRKYENAQYIKVVSDEPIPVYVGLEEELHVFRGLYREPVRKLNTSSERKLLDEPEVVAEEVKPWKVIRLSSDYIL